MPNRFGSDFSPWPNGWTGGQYSVLRALLGACLLVHFVQLSMWFRGLPLAVTIGAAAASLFFAVGLAARWAALCLFIALAGLYGLDPLLPGQGLTYLGWMLLVHALMRKAPYGSLAVRGRPDPGGGWRMPGAVLLGSWLLLGLSYLYSALFLVFGADLEAREYLGPFLLDPFARESFPHDFLASLPAFLVEILFVAALFIGHMFLVLGVLFHRVRPWFWGVVVLVQICIVFLLDFAIAPVAMLLFHLFAIDPGWIRSRKLPERATLFYDGSCALCHRLARFVLAEDVAEGITLSPLQSDYFRSALTAEERTGLPDSIVLKSDDGLLLEGDAAIRILKMLGGLWLALGLVLSAFPRRWRNAAYHYVGDRRYRLFGRTETACPVVSERLLTRFRE
ncbi:MAG: DCC1-like thiol-disulfide oxidoreductase family protein [Gammaproteobacteria bacterium]|nr:DCC1-like thiol-disulfide oxidoreductase family protein [Gammaproteobacteria bacterium]